MKKIQSVHVGDQIAIQSYKHDGSLHRTWSTGVVVEVKPDQWVVVTYKTTVIESNHRMWQTREPAICFFYPDRWYNIISMIRKTGITYYCNIASPSLYDGEALKNIDYDLDLKVYPDGGMDVLDENEFAYHLDKMHYSKDIIDICWQSLNELQELAKAKEGPFCAQTIDYYYHRFFTMRHDSHK